MKSKIMIAATIVALSGCASMFNGSTQPFSVSTANDKLQEETNCAVVNEEGSWQVPPNQTTTINRDGNNMSIQCDNKYQSGSNHIDSKFEGKYLFLDILTGYGIVISIVLDGINNAFYSYPSFVSVAMKDKPGVVIPKKPSAVETPAIENNISINNYPNAAKVDVKEQSVGHQSTQVVPADALYMTDTQGKCYTSKNGRRVMVDNALCQIN